MARRDDVRPLMYKNILIAMDDSSTSLLALKEAIRFAHENPQCFLRIVHVLDKWMTCLEAQAIIPVDLQGAIKQAGILLLQKAESELRSAHVLNFDTKLLELNRATDRIYEEINEEAKSWPANLIIIGTHGRRGFSHFFLGSVAEGIARIASVPVLLVRGKEIR